LLHEPLRLDLGEAADLLDAFLARADTAVRLAQVA
jgi:hypothetical protein